MVFDRGAVDDAGIAGGTVGTGIAAVVALLTAEKTFFKTEYQLTITVSAAIDTGYTEDSCNAWPPCLVKTNGHPYEAIFTPVS